ncbi:hypothetical protein [Vibrio ziniensis]|uniref:Uncharacterized protein n=1 Tax=Vibrio ziniensis TaxID=2711221 RepID=A0A6G7CMZ7_9VIBR|nr:hypothetical protein [Vibrio ziniensis]QIH43444.1 hypothetical protein G5S32_15720 [Vibrio ziniensis]
MTTLAKQESVYGVWTDAGVPDGASVLVQNQSSLGMGIYIYTGAEAPENFDGILVNDWIAFTMKSGEKLFHTPAYKPHEAFNQASVRIDAS